MMHKLNVITKMVFENVKASTLLQQRLKIITLTNMILGFNFPNTDLKNLTKILLCKFIPKTNVINSGHMRLAHCLFGKQHNTKAYNLTKDL